MLRAIHRRHVIDGGLQRPPGANADHDGFLRAQLHLQMPCRGLAHPVKRARMGEVGRNHLHDLEPEAGFEFGTEAQAFADRVVQLETDQARRNRKRHEALGTLAGYAELGRDLILRIAGDIVQPASAGGVVQLSVIAAVLLLRRILQPIRRILKRPSNKHIFDVSDNLADEAQSHTPICETSTRYGSVADH